MSSDFYPEVCAKDGITLIVPQKREQDYIQEKLIKEIEWGVFHESTRQGLLAIIKRMLEENSVEGVILGCTELPLILTRDEFGLPF